MKNIEFKKLYIQNFLSVGNEPLEIEFNNGLNVITGYNRDENDIKKIQNVSNNIKSIVSYLDVSKIILNILNEYGNKQIFDPLLKLKMKLVIKRSINAIDILIQEISKSLDILSDDIIEKMDKLHQ